jgi:hypothetical protein
VLQHGVAVAIVQNRKEVLSSSGVVRVCATPWRQLACRLLAVFFVVGVVVWFSDLFGFGVVNMLLFVVARCRA